MIKINSYEELSRLIFSYLKKGVVTNTFISKEDFEKEIKFGSLYYFTTSAGLWLVRSREEYYILNYYLTNINYEDVAREVFEKGLEKTIIVEIVGKNIFDDKFIGTCKFFEKLGMEVAVQRERFAKKQEDINLNDVDNVEKTLVEILNCGEPDISTVMEIFDDNFDKFYGCIPTKEAIIEDIKNQNLYKALIEDKIVGILHIKKDSKASEIRHLAVVKEARNQGVAGMLLKYYDKDVCVSNKTVWTAKDNVAAQKAYAKNGYQKDGYISKVFRLQK